MNAPVPAFCPHCGSDLKVDTPILLNGFAMFGDGYPLHYNGKVIRLTPQQSALTWTLLKAYPLAVRADALLMRIGSDSESNVIDVVISRVRSKLRAEGIPNPIESVRGVGFRWSLEPVGYRSCGGGRPKKDARLRHGG